MNFRNSLSRHVLFTLIAAGTLNTTGAFALEKSPKPKTAISKAKVTSPILNWQKTELYFGLSRPNGTRITVREWEKFSEREITPRLPNGFTIIDGVGQWRAENKRIVRENTKILVVLHANAPRDRQAIVQLIEIYKKQFSQTSVLCVDANARVQF